MKNFTRWQERQMEGIMIISATMGGAFVIFEFLPSIQAHFGLGLWLLGMSFGLALQKKFQIVHGGK